MVDKYIDIDPDGDTLIILPSVHATNESDDTASDKSSLSNDDDEMNDSSSHSSGGEMSDNSSLSSGNDMDDEASFPSLTPHIPLEMPLDYGMKETNLCKSFLERILSLIGVQVWEMTPSMASDIEVYEDNTTSKDTYYFKVSMKHLSLASLRAKAVLQGPFQESIPTSDGFRHWTFEPIFDPEAFKIVMSIIHAQFHNVPDEVSLELLSKIAIIVDDLHCRDSVHHFAKLWLIGLDKVTQVSDDGLSFARSIFALWVFRLDERFGIETGFAVIHSLNISSSFGLPIPPQILGRQRLEKIIEFEPNRV